MSLSKKLFAWLPPFAWMAVIFYMSSQTSLSGPWWISPVGHIGEYTVLSILFWFALRQTTNLKGNAVIIAVVVMATLYGVSDEWHQLYVANRSPEIIDVLTDFSAAFVAVIVIDRLFREDGKT